MSLLLGCIADDYTGATDLGAMLSRAGMRVVLLFDVPAKPIDPSNCDAVIVALKSRSIPAPDAVKQSLAALSALRQAGAKRFFFKYCSTFDSTDKGNIGPVAVGLAEAVGAQRVLFCPAFPENGRTVYGGYLFVHGKLLNESGMENHPLNPMTDASLLRVLSRQTSCSIGLLPYSAVEAGTAATKTSLETLAEDGVSFVIADTLNEQHLETIATAVEEDSLVTGGSAIGQAMADVEVRRGRLAAQTGAFIAPPPGGAAVVAGSCSQATQRQVAAMQQVAPACHVDPQRLASGSQTTEQVVQWAAEHLEKGPVLIYSTSDPQELEVVIEEIGRVAAGALVEESLARIAAGLVEQGVRKLIVAGGETSGAVLRELGVDAVRIGSEIEPGVPWVETLDEPRLAMALKSGNFGSDDFFRKALEMLT